MRRIGFCFGALVGAALLATATPAQPTRSLLPGLQTLAAKNNPEAIYHLGMLYQMDIEVPVDHRRAFALFQQAASFGDPLGAYKVGCYYAGQDADVVAPNEAFAFKYKLVAAEAGYALAQQDMAIHYAEAKDGAAAARWAEASAAQGWSGGLLTAASIFNVGPVTRDPAKTSAYFRLFMVRVEASPAQRQWLEDFDRQMTATEQARAAALVHNYRAKPTALTLEALAGSRRAEALVAHGG